MNEDKSGRRFAELGIGGLADFRRFAFCFGFLFQRLFFGCRRWRRWTWRCRFFIILGFWRRRRGRRCIRIFRRRGASDGGNRQIVITASIAGYGPLGACPSYAATKACVKSWGLSLRSMYARSGVKVNVVCPGFVRSRITDANTCPMPFFLEADQAAETILRGVDRNRGLIAFPWQMRLSAWLLSVLPWRVNELANRLLPRKSR